MTKFEKTSSLTRRSVLLGGGALVVSVGAGVALDTVLSIGQAFAQGTKPPLTPDARLLRLKLKPETPLKPEALNPVLPH